MKLDFLNQLVLAEQVWRCPSFREHSILACQLQIFSDPITIQTHTIAMF